MTTAIRAILQTIGDPGPFGVVVMLGLGVFVCFLGTRSFRVSAGIIGFLVGMELAGRLAIWQDFRPVPMVVLGLGGGVVLGALFAFFTMVGVFGMGALLAMTLVRAATGVAGRGVGSLDLVLAGLVGGFAGLLLRRHVAVVATALYGGTAAIAAVFALVKRGNLRGAVALLSGPTRGAELAIFLLCVVLMVTGGLVTQFRSGKAPRL